MIPPIPPQGMAMPGVMPPMPMAPPPVMDAPEPKAEKPIEVDVQKWIKAIAAYDAEFKSWEGRTKKIIKKYTDEDRSKDEAKAGGVKFNILWSNVQTAIPAVFSRLPKPDVSRRHQDNDPVGRVASLLIERGLEYEIEHYPDYRAAMKGSVFDRFMGGRGISWVRYEPHFRAAQVGTPEDGFQVTEDADEAEDIGDGSGESQAAEEEIDYECCPVDYVHWRDFGHTIARTWEEVTAVWRKVYMSRPALVERFGEDIGGKIPLDTRPDDDKRSTSQDDLYQACVIEIWDKESNNAIWISKSWPDALDAKHDPLELESFFPCPRPLFGTLTTENLIPTPDFALYQDQAAELDTLCERINGLINALQLKGVHDKAVPELARLFTEAGNGDLIGVANWSAFAEKNGLKGAIDLVDLAPIAQALNIAYDSVEKIKAQIYEITGMSDVIRASSDPRETATATKSKGQFGSMRLRSMQGDVVQYATEILQIKAQIMCGQYQDDSLLQISGASQLSPQDQALIPQALQLIRNNPLRNFRIEVSSDSMIQMDEAQEKQDRTEFMKSAGTYIQGLVQLSASPAAAQIMPLAVDLMKFAVTGFKVGKTLEGAFDELGDKLREQANQPPAPPPPDPAIQVQTMKNQADAQKFQAQQQADQAQMQMQAQIEQQSKQADLQLEQQRMAMEAQADQQRQQNEMVVEQHRQEMQAREVASQNQLEAQRAQQQATLDAQLEQIKTASDERMAAFADQLERWKAELEAATRIEVANIASKAKLQDAATEASTNEISRDVT